MSAVLDWTMLRAHFEKRLAERVVLMEATLAEVEGSDARNARTALERQFHSLAGIAGTYGYPDITDIAREGELRAALGSVTELRGIVESIGIS
jgi:HPt (histidine-containing phosphotransfer) domain-containing protein